ncbi:hypothetical protein L838_5083 [Mycobacterium avium MAV_120709_2344]|nr:hypothetical protein L838_5083 [Mycobacterium avium MAV_120709_2344]
MAGARRARRRTGPAPADRRRRPETATAGFATIARCGIRPDRVHAAIDDRRHGARSSATPPAVP